MSSQNTGSYVVKTIKVVVHTSGAWPNGMSDNHWSFYLILANGQGSVRINMRAEHDDPKGILDGSKPLPYIESQSSIRSWDYPMISVVKVGEICSLIYKNGRDGYDMSGGGSGCRWWIYVVVKDFEKKGYLASTVGSDLWPKLLKQYTKNASVASKDLEMVQGTFTGSPALASASSSASQTALSSSGSTSATAIRKVVQVKSYNAGGRLRYSWRLDGVEDRSFAKEWKTITATNGNPGLLHEKKNLISALPFSH